MNVRKRLAASGYNAIDVEEDEAFPDAIASTTLLSRPCALEKRNIPMPKLQVG